MEIQLSDEIMAKIAQRASRISQWQQLKKSQKPRALTPQPYHNFHLSLSTATDFLLTELAREQEMSRADIVRRASGLVAIMGFRHADGEEIFFAKMTGDQIEDHEVFLEENFYEPPAIEKTPLQFKATLAFLTIVDGLASLYQMNLDDYISFSIRVYACAARQGHVLIGSIEGSEFVAEEVVAF